MGLIEKILLKYPVFNRYSNFDDEELTSLELAGRTVQKVNEVIELVNGIDVTQKENSDDITNKRKLSALGNFTGSINGQPVNLVLANIKSNTDNVKYLANQFADGQTGLIIDGGFFENGSIDRNYNGGVF